MDYYAETLSAKIIAQWKAKTMVTVAQLVEPWIVIPVVAGSNPVSHPNFSSSKIKFLNILFHGNIAIGIPC